jgi:O-methyltransferase
MKLFPPKLAQLAVSGAQRFFRKFKYELLDTRCPFPWIEDSQFYTPLFNPWLMPEWRERLRADDSRSLLPLQAKYVLYCLALDASRRCSGELAECGVYKGGTAKLLAELAQERSLHLFDTFSGMPETDPAKDIHKAGDFADTSLESVRNYLAGHANVTFHPGLIPQSLLPLNDRVFSFVHIDLDIYSAIKSSCEFFYPRLQSGAVLVFDDYGYPSCPGARLAVDEFFADKLEAKLVLPTAQCVVHKI